MSKNLSLKMRDDIYQETEALTKKIHKPRNAYINDAVAFYNKLHKRALLKKEFAAESKLVREHSMEVLEVFEKLEDDLAGAA